MTDSHFDYQVHFDEGVKLYAEGKYEQAGVVFDQLLRINPDDANAWNNRGIALSKLAGLDPSINSDKVTEAITSFEDHCHQRSRGDCQTREKQHETNCEHKP